MRLQRGRETALLNPRGRLASGFENDNQSGFFANGVWNGRSSLPGLGVADRSVFFNHESERSNLGVRLTPERFPQSDLELGLQRSNARSDFYYAMNNQLSLAGKDRKLSFGDGGSKAGAVVVRIDGNVVGKFEVVVNDRVVGYVWSGAPRVISLRPYETYRVRVKSVGEKIIGVDESVHRITLYPGNVEERHFTARELTVLVGQVVHPSGLPVANARFENVEGYGSTDGQGWFQIEVSHREYGGTLQLTVSSE